MSKELRVDRYTVNDIIVSYLEDQFYVNRRYQRRLVWGLKEKQLLIYHLFWANLVCHITERYVILIPVLTVKHSN